MRGKSGFSTTALAFVIGSLACGHAQAQQQPPAKRRLGVHDAALAFGIRPAVLQASLSPDGTKLATVESNGSRASVVRIHDLTSNAEPKVIAGATGDPDRLDWCHWAGTSRLLCQIYGVTRLDIGILTYTTRLVGIDADGGNMKVLATPRRNGMSYGYTNFGGAVLDWNTGKDGHVLMVRRYFPEFSTGTKISSAKDGLGVDDIDTRTMTGIPVESAKSRAMDFITDGHGRIRIMGMDTGTTGEGYMSGRISYSGRPKDNDGWQDIAKLDLRSREGFNPIRVDPQLDTVYGLKKLNGRMAAYGISMDGTRKETLVFARPDVDVAGFITIGRNQRVIGASYVTDRSEVDYFDPQFKRLVAALSKAMPDLPLIRIVDSSQDEKKLLIWAGSDVDPGRYFLLDRATNGMTELLANRLPLEQVALSPVKAVSIPAADGTMIPAYLTLPPGSDGKNLPTIVLPHGGPSARDEWGFDWLSQYWAHIGYAVLQPNFRGSAGYGDQWFQKNGFQGWQTAIGDVTDVGQWLVKQGIADPKKLAIFGWSYGGYAALQAAAVQPDLFRGVIAVAPVTDLAKLREDGKMFSDYLLTADFIGEGKHIVEGSPAKQAAKIKAPVLLFHGTYDRNVPIVQSQIMADSLRDAKGNGRLVTYDKMDHYLDDSLTRQSMLEESAKFFEAAFAK